jgi:tripartite-type tricarboxylate transporter receptor subunit TctC
VVPDLPPVADAVPGFDVSPWFGLVAPAGTRRALADSELRTKLADRGLEIIAGAPEEFRALIAAGAPRIAALVKSRGIKAQ